MENLETKQGKSEERPEEKTGTMRIICAWCGKEMGVKEAEGGSGITHGICPECNKKVREDLQARKKIRKENKE